MTFEVADEVSKRLLAGAFGQRALAREAAAGIARTVNAMADAYSNGHKVLVFGNGGSAAEAQHLASELVGRFERERRPLAAVALTTDGSALTAIGNDYGFEQVFARQVLALGTEGDVAIALSTSGNSLNVLNGVEAARRLGLVTVGLTGSGGSKLFSAVAIPIVVPSRLTSRIQEGHLAVVHVICSVLDDLILGTAPAELPRRNGVRASIHPNVVTWERLDDLKRTWDDQGREVVWTNGCFDLLHIGHLRSLEQARTFGDVLVVGVNSDSSVRTLKGPDRPIVPEEQRAEMVAGLWCVDYVVVFEELTPIEPLLRLRPAVHCKSADYAPENGGALPEAAAVASYGGRVQFLDLVDGVSTSTIAGRTRERALVRDTDGSESRP